MNVKPGHAYRFDWNAGAVAIAVESVNDNTAEGPTVDLLGGQGGRKISYKFGRASVDLERIISFEYWCPADSDHAVGLPEPPNLELPDA